MTYNFVGGLVCATNLKPENNSKKKTNLIYLKVTIWFLK
jgi:hypothetical protein